MASRREPSEVRCGPREYAKCNGGIARCKVLVATNFVRILAASPQTQLVNWTNENFRLKPTAPAIDAGVIIPGFTDGYIGSAPDLGAYEFGGLAWNAGVGSKPTLAIASTGGGNLTLSASPDAAYYRLYMATNLTPPAFWNPVTNEPAALGNRWSMTLGTAANVAGYYRLQAQ